MSLLSFLSGKKTYIVGGAMALKVVATAAVSYGTGATTLFDTAMFLYNNLDPILAGLGLMSVRAAVSKAALGTI